MKSEAFFLLLMTLSGAVGSLFLKKASEENGIMEMIKNKNIYIGAGFYLISAVLNIYILQFLEYSVVLPLTSMTYIWTMMLAYFVLKEKITEKKIWGIILILIGGLGVSI